MYSELSEIPTARLSSADIEAPMPIVQEKNSG